MIGIGDVVVCIRGPDGQIMGTWEPVVGKIYRVKDFLLDDNENLLLNLEEDPDYSPDTGFEADAFKPLRKADTSFTALIKRCRPIPSKQEPVA